MPSLPCLAPPTDAAVVDPFRPPPCPWCPGNRGLEYDTAPGDPLTAMSSGVVSFAGRVAGVLYVTVEYVTIETAASPGVTLRITMGRLQEALVGLGDTVVPGQLIARAGGPTIVTVRIVTAPAVPLPTGTVPGSADRGDGEVLYVDPAPLLGQPTYRARLVPRDGTPARPPTPAGAACGPG